jgi:hypothetical protein
MKGAKKHKMEYVAESQSSMLNQNYLCILLLLKKYNQIYKVLIGEHEYVMKQLLHDLFMQGKNHRISLFSLVDDLQGFHWCIKQLPKIPCLLPDAPTKKCPK